jgi:serine/threonine protein kinase
VLIGRGGMGAVYLALDTRLDRSVAVKILRDAEGADDARFAADVRTLERFVHPNLVRLLDAGELEERAYLVMELIEGRTLAERLVQGRLSSPETAKVGAGVAVYALGLVLLERLSGHRAFEGTPSEITAARMHRAPAIPVELNAGWQAVLRSMTLRLPADRIGAEDVATSLLLWVRIDGPGQALSTSEITTEDATVQIRHPGAGDTHILDPDGRPGAGDTEVLDPTEIALERTDLARSARSQSPETSFVLEAERRFSSHSEYS